MPDFEQPDLVVRSASGFGRAYRHPHTGQTVPSVTTISGLIDKSGFLTKWAEKIAIETALSKRDLFRQDTLSDSDLFALVQKEAQAKREAGRDLGSRVHNAIEALLKGKVSVEQLEEELHHHLKGFAEWFTRYVQRVDLIEETVWSHRYGYAGTLDLGVFCRDGRYGLFDVKAGKEAREDAALQLAGLRSADCLVSTEGERPMPHFDFSAVLHLPAPVMTATGRVSVRGNWSVREIEETGWREDWECFLALRRAKHWEETRKGRCLGGKQTAPILPTEIAFDPAQRARLRVAP